METPKAPESSDNNKTQTTGDKLFFFYHRLNFSESLTLELATLRDLYKQMGYGFPLAHCSVEARKVMETYKTLFGNVKERVLGYDHLLVFDRCLTEEEWKMWRMFKLGYCTRWFGPKRS